MNCLTPASECLRVTSGTVKWFDVSKGFGFLVENSSQLDIMLHANVLANFGQSSIVSGSRVTAKVRETDRGLSVEEILKITDIPSVPQDDLELDQLLYEEHEFLPARVKWFDKSKSFGFVTIFGKTEDYFLHSRVIEAIGLDTLAKGEAIAVRVGEGSRGKVAIEAKLWV